MTDIFNWSDYQQTSSFLHARYRVKTSSLKVFDCLDSTNQKLWQFIEKDSQLPLAVVAQQQTAGKGQWGKTWVSQRGGLYLSVGLPIELALSDRFCLVMATVTGVADILRDFQLPVTIKWSNDLILKGYKLGGIKIETKTKNNIIQYAVIGIGINWQNQVPEPGINLQSYYQSIKEQQPNYQPQIKSWEQLTAITIVGILDGYSNYLHRGIQHTHQRYLRLLNSIGKQIVINDRKGTITGVTPEGKLIICLQSPGAKTNLFFAPGEISIGY